MFSIRQNNYDWKIVFDLFVLSLNMINTYLTLHHCGIEELHKLDFVLNYFRILYFIIPIGILLFIETR